VNRHKRKKDQGIIDERRIENVVSKFWRILIVSVCLVCFVTLGTAFAQKDVKYDGGKDGAVTFVHKAHVGGQKLKCDNCHKDPSLFTKKKEAKITKADHEGKKFCAACHDGKKAFAMTVEADCAKCHKK
jgi:c(7)-type cytochrome triheme protein